MKRKIREIKPCENSEYQGTLHNPDNSIKYEVGRRIIFWQNESVHSLFCKAVRSLREKH